MRFFKILNQLKTSRNICSEFYSRVISQKFSHYFSTFFIIIKVSPNTITTMMGLLIIPISLGLYFSDDTLSVFFAFSLIIINIIDTSDGEVARFLKKTSSKGVFYDKFFQIFADTILLFSLSMKFANYQNKLIFILIFIYMIVYFLNTYLKRLSEIYLTSSDKISKKGNLKSFLSNISSNTFFFHTLWILFVIKIYVQPSLFDYVAILYFLNLIILNTIKSIYIFYNIRSKIK